MDKITKTAAKKILAKIDAAGPGPKTETQLRKLGFVKSEGGTWEIPLHIVQAAQGK